MGGSGGESEALPPRNAGGWGVWGGVGEAKPPPPTPIQKGLLQKGPIQKGPIQNSLIQKGQFGMPQNTIQNTSKSKGPGSAYRATLYGKSYYRVKWEVAIYCCSITNISF